MSNVTVLEKTFNDNETGKAINYRVLAISGILSGEPFTLEFKGSKMQLDLAEVLLKSTEKSDINKDAEQTLSDFIEQ